MNIGIDLRPLQGPHKFRGVGSVTTNILENMSPKARKANRFILFIEDEGKKNVLDSLDLTDLDYEVRLVKPSTTNRSVYQDGLTRKVIRKLASSISFKFGDSRIDLSGLDVYIHTDQLATMPRAKKVKKVMIAYDIIPFVIEWDYLWSYKTARKEGLSKKSSLAKFLNRLAYISKIKTNVKKSKLVLAISEQTKADFINYAKVSQTKIRVWHLGIDPSDNKSEVPSSRFVDTSWGYISRTCKFDAGEKFILYIGGTDARRKIDDLVIAFNHLRARGMKLKLVLCGDILQGSGNLPVKANREALKTSSYADDIIYLGFVSEPEKQWLYKHAIAFVYPSMYEGFGLPVLEAMSNFTPVVTYKNTSLKEVSNDSVYFASDGLSIANCIQELVNKPQTRQKMIDKGHRQAMKFSWATSIEKLFSTISSD